MRSYLRGVVAAVAFGVFAAGCADTGNLGVSMPLKQTLMGGAAAEPDIQEHGPLVMPPPNAALPVPGQAQSATVQDQQWPVEKTKAKQKKQAAATKKETTASN
jgi:hypothetical protein